MFGVVTFNVHENSVVSSSHLLATAILKKEALHNLIVGNFMQFFILYTTCKNLKSVVTMEIISGI